MKTKASPELYLAFHVGLTVKQLIAKGYKPITVYNYSRRYKTLVRPAFEEMLKRPEANLPG